MGWFDRFKTVLGGSADFYGTYVPPRYDNYVIEKKDKNIIGKRCFLDALSNADLLPTTVKSYF